MRPASISHSMAISNCVARAPFLSAPYTNFLFSLASWEGIEFHTMLMRGTSDRGACLESRADNQTVSDFECRAPLTTDAKQRKPSPRRALRFMSTKNFCSCRSKVTHFQPYRQRKLQVTLFYTNILPLNSSSVDTRIILWVSHRLLFVTRFTDVEHDPTYDAGS